MPDAEEDRPLDWLRDTFWTVRRFICVLRWHADKRPHSRWCGYGLPPASGRI